MMEAKLSDCLSRNCSVYDTRRRGIRLDTNVSTLHLQLKDNLPKINPSQDLFPPIVVIDSLLRNLHRPLKAQRLTHLRIRVLSREVGLVFSIRSHSVEEYLVSVETRE